MGPICQQHISKVASKFGNIAPNCPWNSHSCIKHLPLDFDLNMNYTFQNVSRFTVCKVSKKIWCPCVHLWTNDLQIFRRLLRGKWLKKTKIIKKIRLHMNSSQGEKKEKKENVVGCKIPYCSVTEMLFMSDFWSFLWIDRIVVLRRINFSREEEK